MAISLGEDPVVEKKRKVMGNITSSARSLDQPGRQGNMGDDSARVRCTGVFRQR